MQHMTNTLNTPVEALEYAYPLQVIRYEIRRGSGGKGRFWGGHGIRRDIQAMGNAQVSLISERRRLPPYGLAGGSPGQLGANYIVRNNEEVQLPGKGTFELKQGDILSIRTPGGAGSGGATHNIPGACKVGPCDDGRNLYFRQFYGNLAYQWLRTPIIRNNAFNLALSAGTNTVHAEPIGFSLNNHAIMLSLFLIVLR
jgi:hypothetical protein